MKTVKEMLDFSAECKCKMTKAMSKGVEVVAQNLSENEVVNYCIGEFAEGNNAQIAFAITNLRVIAAQKKMFSDTVIAIPISHINDLTTKTKLTGDFIIIGNDAGENLTISVYKGLGTSVANALHLAMASSERRQAEPDVASDLRKFKALLDDGIITEDEFLKKKQQLLGL